MPTTHRDGDRSGRRAQRTQAGGVPGPPLLQTPVDNDAKRERRQREEDPRPDK